MSPLVLFALELAAVLVPLMLISWRTKTFPRAPLVYLLLVPALLALLPFAAALAVGLARLVSGGVASNLAVSVADVLAIWKSPYFWTVLVVINAGVLLVALFDILGLPKVKTFAVERAAGRIASLRKPHHTTLVVTNFSRGKYPISVVDWIDDGLAPEPAAFDLVIGPTSRATLETILRPTRRGAYTLDRVEILVASPLGLWQRQLRYPVETTIHVYPDLQQVSQYAMLARVNRLNLLGVRRTRRTGGDNEFERLRDYTPDDNYKHIDWRATARRRKLTVKDFQTDQSQSLIFLLDCGRMMTNEAGGMSLLDHSLNAMLLLSYVALAHGDHVGLVTFSSDVHGFVPPAGGRSHINKLLHAVFDRFPERTESRYDRAFMYLGKRCPKRALVVLFTNLIDEVNSNQVEQYLKTISGRHLPFAIWLRDRRIFEYADHPHPVGLDLHRAAAAADLLLWRHQVLVDLASKGVLSLDVYPEDLTASLVNRYLEIKARRLL